LVKKCPEPFSKETPKFAFLGEKSAKLTTVCEVFRKKI
jgi:hypothetical protein